MCFHFIPILYYFTYPNFIWLKKSVVFMFILHIKMEHGLNWFSKAKFKKFGTNWHSLGTFCLLFLTLILTRVMLMSSIVLDFHKDFIKSATDFS